MYLMAKFVFPFLVLMLLMEKITSLVEFTNLKCDTVNKDIAEFEYCTLKSINRTYKYATAKIKLHQIPITRAKVNFGLYKRLNGYKPFLYNQTINACTFFKNQRASPVAKYFYDIIKGVSNLNHSCPYNHDIIIDKLSTEIINYHSTQVLAYPEGNYMLESHWILNDNPAIIVQVYLSLS
ncbi:uncharacterized protein LOC108107968 [Drosophila eugracilis]|uniref:uncharacterized protein LOC108107968 n=1 Tax=Drosophila eugracilis TaxID=29029 RepID=UPI001BDB4F0A|nr:uncharacterized protein LOC108107968 [Drosophila eugracilis]